METPIGHSSSQILRPVHHCQGTYSTPFKGHDFTSSRGHIKERLDRAYCNQRWFLMLHSIICLLFQSLIIAQSLLILGNISDRPKNNIGRRFERWWTSLHGFSEALNHFWTDSHSTPNQTWYIKSQNLLHNLFIWGKNHPDNHKNNVQNLWQLMTEPYNHNNHHDINTLTDKLDKALIQQEDYWHQKSRIEWLKQGNKNTKFFHHKATSRWHRNYISTLQDRWGNGTTNHNKLADLLYGYFMHLFSSEGSNSQHLNCLPIHPISSSDQIFLNQPFSNEEIKDAVWKLGAWKAPRPDGLSIGFYKESWPLVGH